MKNIFCVIILSLLFSSSVFADCSDAEYYASDAYSDARRAYNSSDLDDCQSYARRAKSSASDAEYAASSCNQELEFQDFCCKKYSLYNEFILVRKD